MSTWSGGCLDRLDAWCFGVRWLVGAARRSFVKHSAQLRQPCQRTRGGFRDRVPDRSTGSAPARSGSEPSVAVDVSFSRVSAATRVRGEDDEDPALRELSDDAEAWCLVE